MFDSPFSARPPGPAEPSCASPLDYPGADLRNAQIEVFGDLAAAGSLWADDRQSLAYYVFQCHEWLCLWQETLGKTLGVCPYLVRVADAEGKTLLLIPLGIRRFFVWKVLVFLGGGVSDYNGVVVARALQNEAGAASIVRLWQEILKRLPPVDVVWLSQMPEHIEGIRNPFVALPHSAQMQAAAYSATPLPASFQAFREAHKSQIFSATERKRRKATKLGKGEIAFKVLDDVQAIDDAVEFAMARKRERYGDNTLPASYQTFYRKMTRASWVAGAPHVCRLQVGNVTIASHIGVVHRGRFYFLIPGFEGGEWAILSPGNQLTVEMIKWCIANEVDTFDMTIGNEEYKRFFTDTRMPLYACRYAVSGRGKAMLAFLNVHAHIRRLGRRKSISAPFRESVAELSR